MLTPSALIQKVKDAVSKKSPESPPSRNVKAVSFKDIRNLNRPAPTWRWNLILPPLPSEKAEEPKTTAKNPILKAISKFLSAAPDSRVILCETIDVHPTLDLGKEDRYYNGRMVSFPGQPATQPITATFYETEDYATTDYFNKWMKQVYNKDTRIYGVPAVYGKDIEFIALPVVDNEALETTKQRYMSIVLKKCWPSNLRGYEYGNTTDRIKVRVDLNYLDYELTIVGGSPSDSKSDAGSLMNKVSQWRS
jgi:hypothetical protein